ncbi:hypothetical protein, partial [uncultured Nostoc sp.]|uniref:hypothetical protein n=1 Tax=uncultured Nostoc sp. TaxID=340711 RepID=UPI0035C943E0
LPSITRYDQEMERLIAQVGVQPGYVQNGTRCKLLLTSLQSCRLYGVDFTKTHSLDAEYMTYSVLN